jgi:hypothetical protein
MLIQTRPSSDFSLRSPLSTPLIPSVGFSSISGSTWQRQLLIPVRILFPPPPLTRAGSLIVVFIPYFILACATCGVMASVVCIVQFVCIEIKFLGSLCQLSCVWCRFWATCRPHNEDVLCWFVDTLSMPLISLALSFSEVSDAGTYALVGAAAMIGDLLTVSFTHFFARWSLQKYHLPHCDDCRIHWKSPGPLIVVISSWL